ncbi:hypothetical protein [Maribacter sp. 4U21]|uniref:hypothetical protein n=1 Tax=Maribacter sp. 4U21 TaxID=1889779 RepID=UPI00118088C5|nr:hypothetical protein [Maribacter sp. 4U21]
MYKVINSTLVLNPSNPMKIYERSYIGKQYNANFIREEVYHLFVSYAYSTEIYQTNAKSSKAIRISVPVFNQDHTISAYFLGSPNGLELIFCKKDEAGEWYRYAESLVWIS